MRPRVRVSAEQWFVRIPSCASFDLGCLHRNCKVRTKSLKIMHNYHTGCVSHNRITHRLSHDRVAGEKAPLKHMRSGDNMAAESFVLLLALAPPKHESEEERRFTHAIRSHNKTLSLLYSPNRAENKKSAPPDSNTNFYSGACTQPNLDFDLHRA